MKNAILLTMLAMFTLISASPTYALSEQTQTKAESADDAFLDMVQKQTFKYFLDEYHPETGLINDNAANKGDSLREIRTSIAATGFGINAFIIGAERGWIPKKEAYERILMALKFFYERAESEHGFFHHFLDGHSGKNAYDSEVSSIDTALLAAGMLTAGQYFPDTEVAELSKKIYEHVDFSWMQNGTPYISMGWHKDSGFLPSYWSNFDEALLLYILAIGSPIYPVPGDSWKKVKKNIVEREGETFVFAGPLFIHQYPHVWLDLKNKNDGVTDYFENSRRATRANKRFSEANESRFKTYKEGFWGLSAFDGPYGYKAYGAIDKHSHDGTVSPAAAGASIVFEPILAISQMRRVYQKHKSEMWGRYGFSDSMNLHENWYSNKVIGIDAGALISMIENYRTGLIWRFFMQNTSVTHGLELAGFVEGTKEPSLSKAPTYTAFHRSERAIKIDGKLDDWKDTEAIRLDSEKHADYGSVLGSQDLSGTVSFLWDENYLYLLGDVKDDQIVSKRTVRYSYKDDLLELFLDLDSDGFRWKNPRDPQLGFSFDPKTKRPRLYNWGEEKEIKIQSSLPEAVSQPARFPVLKMNLTESGYIIEAAVPWKLLSITPSNPLELAVTPALHDLDGQKEEAKLSWHFRDRGEDRGIELGRINLRKADTT